MSTATTTVLPPGAQTTAARLERLLSLADLIALTDLSKTTIYREMRANRFPKPIAVSPNRRAWRSSVIARWIAERSNGTAPPVKGEVA